MPSTRRVLPLFAVCATFLVGACAEGTKVDPAIGSASGGAASTVGSSGTTGVSKGGSTTSAKGGTVGSGGKATLLTNGGMASTTTLASSGSTTSSLGGSVTGSGGTSSVGAASATGGAAVSTVPAPVSGLGIKLTKQSSETTQSATTLVLVNQGGGAIDLATVEVRYYFTIDAWSTPVFDIDYAGPIVANSSIKSSLFTLQSSQPNADRYFELSFTAGSLGATGQTEIQSRLHDQSYVSMTVSNDYSFTGTLGFTDRITAYVGGQLVWGVEPGTTPLSGAGGAGGGGSAGSAGSDSAGASPIGGNSNGGTAGATGIGTAGTTSGGDNTSAGSAGAADMAGSAGSTDMAGSAGST